MNVALFLTQQLSVYHQWDFIVDDPIQIPHQYKKKQDIEIAAFFACLFALGKRQIVIQKTNLLLSKMDNTPFDFIKNFTTKDLKLFDNFAHRFFKYEDIKFLFLFLQHHYKNNDSLESAFTNNVSITTVFDALINFQNNIFKTPHTKRSEKHISTPLTNSACKRLNLLLRWLIRKDKYNIDFDIWSFVKPADLIIPLDVHVLNVCKKLHIIHSSAQASWKTAVEITNFLKQIDNDDPVKFDFVFMGLGVNKKLI